VSDFVKRFFVCVLVCFLLCSSVLADFEDSISDSVEVAPSEPVEVAPSEPVEVVPSEPVEVKVTPDEGQVSLEKVDSVVDSVSDLVDTATSETAPGESISEVSSGGNTVYVLTQPDSEVVRDVAPTPVSIDDPGVTITAISLSSVAPVTPSSTSGLKAALLGILGNYDPVIVEYQYSSGNGYTNYLREVQPDYVWLCSAALLALVIYCLFKLGGGLIRG
jgi:hypothetical protein